MMRGANRVLIKCCNLPEQRRRYVDHRNVAGAEGERVYPHGDHREGVYGQRCFPVQKLIVCGQ